jgi:dTDP-4-amino-4,6-dideoxygalactose transaminase
MSWRHQPPALSPVAPAGLLAGFGAVIGGGGTGNEFVTDELKRRYNATDVLLTDSGTSALVIALQSLVPRGGTVAYPAYACIDLTAAALRAGVKVRLYDLDPLTLSPDMDSLRDALERGVDAVLVAHLYGYPADVTAVNALAAERGIPVIEDAAQAAGGTLHGARLGGLADVSILSFGRGKGTTAGSGGALLSRSLNRSDVTSRMAGVRLGKGARGAQEIVALSAQWLLARSELYRFPASLPALKLGEMTYKAATEPRSISTAAAAILPIALRMEEREVSHRRMRAKELIALLRRTRGELLPIHCIPGGEAGFLRLAFVDATGGARPNKSIGVMRGYPLTLDQHEQLAPILATGECAGRGAERLRDRLFTAPTHSRVTTSDVGRFERWLVSSHSSVRLQAVAT